MACAAFQVAAPRKDDCVNISVVIPARNAAGYLPRCLAALAASTRRPNEILVVDDRSTDSGAMVAELSGARVIRMDAPGRGPAAARNRGAQAARGDVIAFVDADTAVHADALALAEKALSADSQVAACFGSYDDTPAARNPVSLYRNLLHHYVHQHSAEEAWTFWAGCGMIRKRDLTAVGGFDEAYVEPSIEDIELGYRLCSSGRRVRLLKAMQSTHLKPWTLREMLRTDLLSRAAPWTRLILRTRKVRGDLNLSWANRLSVMAVWGGVLGVCLAPFDVRLLIALPAGWGAAILLNIGFLRFLAQKGGPKLAAVGTGLHLLHLLCAGAGMLMGLGFAVRDRFRRPTQPAAVPPATTRST
jgi:hypothetical protein